MKNNKRLNIMRQRLDMAIKLGVSQEAYNRLIDTCNRIEIERQPYVEDLEQLEQIKKASKEEVQK
jgi:hypothetical protein